MLLLLLLALLGGCQPKEPPLSPTAVAFKKEVLTRYLQSLEVGYWEAYLYSKLREENATLFSEPRMIVFHTGPFHYGYYLRQRYLFSRAYAGAHRSVMPASRLLMYIAASPALPVLLLARMGARVWQKRHRVTRFVQCLPLLVPVSFVYVFGELAGYLAGPGDSLLKVE